MNTAGICTNTSPTLNEHPVGSVIIWAPRTYTDVLTNTQHSVVRLRKELLLEVMLFERRSVFVDVRDWES